MQRFLRLLILFVVGVVLAIGALMFALSRGGPSQETINNALAAATGQALAAQTSTARTATALQKKGTVEPSQGLGMSQEVWEARAGSPVGKGAMGQKYTGGAEITFMDGKVWRIDYPFPEKGVIPADAQTAGKGL